MPDINRIFELIRHIQKIKDKIDKNLRYAMRIFLKPKQQHNHHKHKLQNPNITKNLHE